jgi:hypothetical protein
MHPIQKKAKLSLVAHLTKSSLSFPPAFGPPSPNAPPAPRPPATGHRRTAQARQSRLAYSESTARTAPAHNIEYRTCTFLTKPRQCHHIPLSFSSPFHSSESWREKKGNGPRDKEGHACARAREGEERGGQSERVSEREHRHTVS